MNWLYYLLEANLYLAIFYGFYRMFLHKETFYTLNRYFLIAAALISFVLPALQVSYLYGIFGRFGQDKQIYTGADITGHAPSSGHLPDTGQILTAAYLLILIVLLTKMLMSLYQVISLAISARRHRAGKIIYVELKDSTAAFSFFNLLFINPGTQETATILKHEMVHIRQRHSLDVLFFELIQVVNWFSPITWLIKKDIRLLHEYIADEITTGSEIQKHDYAMLLIRNSLGNIPSPLTNQIFNQSILKRRINMLNKKRSAGRTRLRYLCVLPLTGSMLCASTLAFSNDYKVLDLYSKKHAAITSMFQEPEKKKAAKQVPPAPKPVKEVKLAPPPPPPAPPKTEQVKFPPPVRKKQYKPGEVKFPPPVVKPSAPKKASPAEPVKFPPPIVTKDVPPPPPAPQTDKKTTEGTVTYNYSINEAGNADSKPEVRQVKFKNEKGQAKNFTYQISVKTDQSAEKVKPEVKEIRISEPEKEPAKTVKKD